MDKSAKMLKGGCVVYQCVVYQVGRVCGDEDDGRANYSHDPWTVPCSQLDTTGGEKFFLGESPDMLSNIVLKGAL